MLLLAQEGIAFDPRETGEIIWEWQEVLPLLLFFLAVVAMWRGLGWLLRKYRDRIPWRNLRWWWPAIALLAFLALLGLDGGGSALWDALAAIVILGNTPGLAGAALGASLVRDPWWLRALLTLAGWWLGWLAAFVLMEERVLGEDLVTLRLEPYPEPQKNRDSAQDLSPPADTPS